MSYASFPPPHLTAEESAMRTCIVRVALSAALTAAVGTRAAGAQATGTIVGTVLNAETRAPLPAAAVLVAGTLLGEATNAEGRFVIREVPVGMRTLRVRLLGF